MDFGPRTGRARRFGPYAHSADRAVEDVGQPAPHVVGAGDLRHGIAYLVRRRSKLVQVLAEDADGEILAFDAAQRPQAEALLGAIDSQRIAG